jgi:hypothetical protein
MKEKSEKENEVKKAEIIDKGETVEKNKEDKVLMEKE